MQESNGPLANERQRTNKSVDRKPERLTGKSAVYTALRTRFRA